MHLARRDVGALTRAHQRCLARRVATLEFKAEVGTRRLAQLLLGGVVEMVASDAANQGTITVSAAADTFELDFRVC